jgi:N-succinyldiaminopimelate aminotransferase
LVVSDEVYEHLVSTDAPEPHTPLAAFAGMRDRVLRVSSAGKTFSCTGWKIGWISGPSDLIAAGTSR